LPSLQGCRPFGKTVEEAIEMAKEAIELYIKTLVDLGKEIPTEEGPFEYTVVVEAYA
jgi:antitoxin HicB